MNGEVDLESIRDRALEVLGPLGFEDCHDDENPAVLWHSGLKRSYDMSASDPFAIVSIVAKDMFDAGYKKAQADIRKAMGVE